MVRLISISVAYLLHFTPKTSGNPQISLGVRPQMTIMQRCSNRSHRMAMSSMFIPRKWRGVSCAFCGDFVLHLITPLQISAFTTRLAPEPARTEAAFFALERRATPEAEFANFVAHFINSMGLHCILQIELRPVAVHIGGVTVATPVLASFGDGLKPLQELLFGRRDSHQ